MCEVIVITSGKGGVGKTTSTANIGTGLAMNGKRVVMIDADIGLRNLDVVMGLENRIVNDLVGVIEGNCRVNSALIKDKRCETLYLLPASQTRDKDAVTPEQMKKLCEELKESFDYIIIDCPAGIEQGFKNAIAAVDKAIVVTTPEVSAVRDADKVIGILESQRIDAYLVINRVKQDMIDSGKMMSIDDVSDVLRIEILGIVPDDEDVTAASNVGEPLIMMDSCQASTAYKNIVRRLNGEIVPFMNLESRKEKGFFDKILSFFKRK